MIRTGGVRGGGGLVLTGRTGRSTNLPIPTALCSPPSRSVLPPVVTSTWTVSDAKRSGRFDADVAPSFVSNVLFTAARADASCSSEASSSVQDCHYGRVATASVFNVVRKHYKDYINHFSPLISIFQFSDALIFSSPNHQTLHTLDQNYHTHEVFYPI